MGLLKQFHGPLRADFRREYGTGLDVALRDWPLTEVADCAANLPPGSAVERAEFPDSWWVTEEVRFLREIEHAIRLSQWLTAAGRTYGKTPEQMWLPGDPKSESEKYDRMTIAEAREFLGWSESEEGVSGG